MRIAFILSRVTNLGPFIVARDIVNNIYDKVEAADVYYLRETGEKLSFKTNCIKITFQQKIDFSKYDLVHSHGFVADAYVSFHRKSIPCKTITTLHQRIAPDYTMKYNAILGYTFEKLWCFFIRNSSVVTLTNELVQYYKPKLKCEIHYIYNGINPPEVTSQVPIDEVSQIKLLKEKYKIIGITARLIHLKGIDQLIESLAQTPDYALLVLGDGHKRKELEQLAIKLGVEERCLFFGYKKNPLNYYKYYDVYAMASRSEGFGLSVLEAASQKVPVVCSDLPVFREIFDEDEVVRFRLENIQSLINALDKAIAQSKVLSENLYKKYVSKFTATAMANNYLSFYKRLLQFD